MANEIADLQNMIQKFCDERDWGQFHTAKDIAIGISTESAELLELFRFRSDAECTQMLNEAVSREKISDELSDVFFFILRFAKKFDINLATALHSKMKKNAAKYPVDKSRGSNKKYDEL